MLSINSKAFTYIYKEPYRSGWNPWLLLISPQTGEDDKPLPVDDAVLIDKVRVERRWARKATSFTGLTANFNAKWLNAVREKMGDEAPIIERAIMPSRRPGLYRSRTDHRFEVWLALWGYE